MTQREDVMRAALEAIRGRRYERGTTAWAGQVAAEALVEVDALPENDTEELLDSSHRSLSIAMEELDAANVRLAQIADLLEESIHEDVDGGLDRFLKALRLAHGEA